METDGDTSHVVANREHWNQATDEWTTGGERAWAQATPTWGIWQIAESDMALLPPDMRGMRAVELGCGTGYVSSWMNRRGAEVVGVDVSERQLATAARLMRRHGLGLGLVQASAEQTPLCSESFDFAISEHGAATWCDPYRWIPEAHRLLRPGAELVFLSSSTLALLCSPLDGSVPITERLERDYFSIHRVDWSDAVDDPGGVEFALPMSRWVSLFRDTGFQLVDYIEIQAPTTGGDLNYFTTADWANRWPSEHVFKVRKNG